MRERQRFALVCSMAGLLFAGAVSPAVCVELAEHFSRVAKRAETELGARMDEERIETRKLMRLAGGAGR